ncbi:MAG: hypothetical protein JW751_11895 [Polyangiaceae bacterium]|nr:hypothetical protein [Polyangiaceae bacterium]
MNSGDVVVVEFAMLWPLQVLIPYVVMRRDVAALPSADRARAWPDATIGVAALLGGPLAVPVHFLLAHRSLRGAALGVAWTAAMFLVLVALDTLLLAVLPMDTPP